MWNWGREYAETLLEYTTFPEAMSSQALNPTQNLEERCGVESSTFQLSVYIKLRCPPFCAEIPNVVVRTPLHIPSQILRKVSHTQQVDTFTSTPNAVFTLCCLSRTNQCFRSRTTPQRPQSPQSPKAVNPKGPKRDDIL